jgi:hypothetical protein
MVAMTNISVKQNFGYLLMQTSLGCQTESSNILNHCTEEAWGFTMFCLLGPLKNHKRSLWDHRQLGCQAKLSDLWIHWREEACGFMMSCSFAVSRETWAAIGGPRKLGGHVDLFLKRTQLRLEILRCYADWVHRTMCGHCWTTQAWGQVDAELCIPVTSQSVSL